MMRYALCCLWMMAVTLTLSGRPDENDPETAADGKNKTDSIMIDRYDLEGVVISANKRETSIMEVPLAVTMLSGLRAETERITATTDLTGPVPNLYMPDYGSRLTSPIYIRGIGSRINAPSVGFYMDEAAMFEKAAFNLDFYNVKRIEVLRGPQGTLYGRNTLGGIVHVITREPSNRFGIRASGEWGNYGHHQYRLMVENPVIKNKLFLQLNGNFRHRNGFYINEFDGNPVDRMNSGGGRFKLLFRPSPTSKIVFSAYGDLSREGAYPYAVVPEEGEDLTIHYNHASSYRRDMIGSSLQYERNGQKVRLNSITSFQNLKGFQDIDQDFTTDDLFNVTQDQDQQLVTQEFRIGSAEGRSKISWITGVYGFYQVNDQTVGVGYGEDGIARFGLPFSSYSYQKLNDMTNYGLALFGQGSAGDLLIENLELTLGLRVDYEKDALDYNYEKYIDGATVPAEDFVSDFSFFEILPKVSLNYSWTEHQMNYLSITRGYKSGGFNTTFEREEDRSFNPEFSWNYEVGWKALLRQKANLRVALFYIDWKDLQVYQPVPSGRGSMLKNAASAYSQGAELEVNVLPVENLRLSGSVGYSDVRFREFVPDPDETVDYGGNKVPYVPDLTGFLAATYRMPLDGGLFHDLVFAANWRQTGKIYWNDANEYEQDPYGLMGANVSVGISDFTLRIWSENLMNTTYRSFQFTALGNVYAQPGRPRQMGLTLTYQF